MTDAPSTSTVMALPEDRRGQLGPVDANDVLYDRQTTTGGKASRHWSAHSGAAQCPEAPRHHGLSPSGSVVGGKHVGLCGNNAANAGKAAALATLASVQGTTTVGLAPIPTAAVTSSAVEATAPPAVSAMMTVSTW